MCKKGASMKRLSWLQNGVQARDNEGRGSHGNTKHQSAPSTDSQKANVVCTIYQAEMMAKNRTSKLLKDLEFNSEYGSAAQFTSTTAVWSDSGRSPKHSQMSNGTSKNERKPTIRQVPSFPPSKCSNSTTRGRSPPKKLHDGASSKNHNLSVQPTIHSNLPSPPPRPPLRHRNNSSASSSIIFEKSAKAPVTIIVTTPDEELPITSSGSPIPPTPTVFTSKALDYFADPSTIRNLRINNNSTMSLPTIPRPTIDSSNLLKPPMDPQLDARKMRKAHEFREVRKFLIKFLNDKGDQFPMLLRARIMDGYGIREFELDPNVVRKFQENMAQDEGVALGHSGGMGMDSKPGEQSDADHLRILEQAFQSLIPVVTPKVQRPASPPLKSAVPIPSSSKSKRRSSTATAAPKRSDSTKTNKTVPRRFDTQKATIATPKRSDSTKTNKTVPRRPDTQKMAPPTPKRSDTDKTTKATPQRSNTEKMTIRHVTKEEKDDEFIPPVWLAPLITKSSSEWKPEELHRHSMRKANSAPNLTRDEPEEPMYPSHPAARPLGDARSTNANGNWLRLDEGQRSIVSQQKEGKRHSFMAGMREAFGGGGEDKRKEKRRSMWDVR